MRHGIRAVDKTVTQTTTRDPLRPFPNERNLSHKTLVAHGFIAGMAAPQAFEVHIPRKQLTKADSILGFDAFGYQSLLSIFDVRQFRATPLSITSGPRAPANGSPVNP